MWQAASGELVLEKHGYTTKTSFSNDSSRLVTIDDTTMTLTDIDTAADVFTTAVSDDSNVGK